MGQRLGKRTIELSADVFIDSAYALVGKKEKEGPLGEYFQNTFSDDTFEEKTFEKAERIILSKVIEGAYNAQEEKKDLDLLLGGDLLNQIISTTFTAREMGIPLLGLYSACSTMSESLAIGSCLVAGGFARNVACATVSHFSSAERQYRFPLEQGSQRPPLSQWTVTGGGAVILSNKCGIAKIKRIVFGEVIDFGIMDTNNMGGAMAPAAMDTLCHFFADTGEKPENYDLILTGDLGVFGSKILRDLMNDRDYEIPNHQDCGALIYHENKDRFQGGSGAGCSAAVFSSWAIEKLKKGEIKKMLFLATGALLSTTSSMQGETIPSISHLVEIVKA